MANDLESASWPDFSAWAGTGARGWGFFRGRPLQVVEVWTGLIAELFSDVDRSFDFQAIAQSFLIISEIV